MPTLANIQGKTLVPDLRGTISDVAKSFGQAQQRLGTQEAAGVKAEQTEDLLKILQGGTDAEQESALNRLAILQSPAVANSLRANIASGNEQELDKLKLLNERGLKDTIFLQDIDDPVKRAQAIKSLAAEPGRTPQEIQDFANLLNKTKDLQDLELSKDFTSFNDVKILTDRRTAQNKRAFDKQEKKLTQDRGTIANLINEVKGMSPAVGMQTLQNAIPALKAQGIDTSVLEGVTNAQNATLGFEQNLAIAGSQVETPVAGAARRKIQQTPLTETGKINQDIKNNLISASNGRKLKNTPPELQSTAGKILTDLHAAEQFWGKGSTQAKEMQKVFEAEIKGEGPKFSDTAGIRKEFSKESGEFIKMNSAVQKVRSSSQRASAAGDLAMIFNFMKVLDPPSVVREGEQASARNVAGVDDRIKNIYNRLLTGESLTPKQRKDFLDTANSIFADQMKQQLNLEKSFGGIAERQGFAVEDVIVDYIGPNRPKAKKTMNPQEKRNLLNRFNNP